MSKLKIDQDKIALETKTQVLSEVQKAVHHFLYGTRETKSIPVPTPESTHIDILAESNISTIQLFQLIQNKTVTTSDIINTFAKELRREVE